VKLVLAFVGGPASAPFDKAKQQRLASLVAAALPLGQGKAYSPQHVSVSEVSQTPLRAPRRALLAPAPVYQTTLGLGLQPTPQVTTTDLQQAISPESGLMTRLGDALAKSAPEWLIPGEWC
jgi:hypothetical protein